MVIRKPGEKNHPDCIQEQDEPEEKDKKQKRFHCWAAVSWNLKSDIIFYEVPSNSNDKMSHQVYINQILEPVVKPWLERGADFVLEEDGDTGHGRAGINSAATRWKEQHGLRYYANWPHSPDLSIIENCWQTSKQHVGRITHWEEETLKEGIRQGWAHVSQESINKRVLSMPTRTDDVTDREGKMTGW